MFCIFVQRISKDKKKKKGCEPKHSYSECKLKRDPLGGGEPQDIYIYITTTITSVYMHYTIYIFYQICTYTL